MNPSTPIIDGSPEYLRLEEEIKKREVDLYQSIELAQEKLAHDSAD
jgi:hypothetical protein